MTPMVGSQGWVRILLGRAGLGSLMDIRSWQVSGALHPGGQVGQGAGAGRPSGARLAGAGSGWGQAGAQACGSVGLSGHRLSHGGRGALQALSAHMVVLLPVLVLAEGAAVAGRVATAARLAGLAPTISAALEVRGDDQGGLGLPRFPQAPTQLQTRHTLQTHRLKPSQGITEQEEKKTQRSQAHR